MLKNKFLLNLTIYLIGGLVGLFILSRYFLPGNFILAGHDSGLPLDAKGFFLSRLYAWDDRLGFGIDNSHLFGSLTLHAVDYFSGLIGGTPYAGNWFNLFFWLGAIFVAAIILAYQLKDILSKYLVFILPPLLIFNFYLFQSIFILERAKYSVLVGILLFLAVFLRWRQQKTSLLSAGLQSSLIFFFFNGGSLLGLPLFGSFLIVALAILLFDLLRVIKSRSFSYIFKTSVFFVLFVLFSALLNSYQLLPYLQNIVSQEFFVHTGVSAVSQNRGWLDYISQNTSWLNLLRMQGVPNWFIDVFKIHPDHPYSYIYLTNQFFIALSFLLPILAFLSLVLFKEFKQKSQLLLFALIALLAIPFAAGTHPPFGFLYNLLFDNIPGFFIFRTPYYKFIGAFYIGLAVLLAATLAYFVGKLENKLKILPGFIICIFIITLWLGYHYNLLIPQNVFTWKKGYSTRFEMPPYIQQFKEWDSAQKYNKRILLLPPLQGNKQIDSYTFGYWSLSPLTYSLSSGTILIDDAALSGGEKTWVEGLYSAIEQKDSLKIIAIANRLNVGRVLLRKDFEKKELVENYFRVLADTNIFEKIDEFGQWQLYKIKSADGDLINILNSFYLVPRKDEDLGRSFDISGNYAFEEFDYSKLNVDNFVSRKIKIYECQSCDLENLNTGDNLPPVSVYPNSPFYFIKDLREEEKLKKSLSDSDKIDSYLGFIARRNSEVRSMVLLGVESRYILSNIKKINLYLDEIKNILDRHPELSGSYTQAQQILNLTNPVLNSIRKIINTAEFSFKPREVRAETYEMIWRLNNLVSFFTPQADFPKLRSNKKYLIGSEGEFFFSKEELTKNTDGQIIMPGEIIYQIEGKERKIEYEKAGDNWLTIKIPEDLKTNGEIIMKYNLENLFKFEKRSQELTPSGAQGCISGRIINFEAGQMYEINVQAKNKVQKLKLFFQGKEKSKFIDSEYGVDLSPVEASIPYRYVYQSFGDGEISLIYVCSGDRDYPDLEAIEIYQLFQPRLLSISDQKNITTGIPYINYQKINPTKYSISINQAPNPFILTLNERFSRFWKIYQVDVGKGKKKIEEYNHFMINGYANAWLIDNIGDSKWLIEFSPQPLFYVGLTITGFSLISAISALTFLSIKSRKGKL